MCSIGIRCCVCWELFHSFAACVCLWVCMPFEFSFRTIRFYCIQQMYRVTCIKFSIAFYININMRPKKQQHNFNMLQTSNIHNVSPQSHSHSRIERERTCVRVYSMLFFSFKMELIFTENTKFHSHFECKYFKFSWEQRRLWVSVHRWCWILLCVCVLVWRWQCSLWLLMCTWSFRTAFLLLFLFFVFLFLCIERSVCFTVHFSHQNHHLLMLDLPLKMLICCKSFERSHRHTKRYFALHIWWMKKKLDRMPTIWERCFFYSLQCVQLTTGPVGLHSTWHLNSFSFFFFSLLLLLVFLFLLTSTVFRSFVRLNCTELFCFQMRSDFLFALYYIRFVMCCCFFGVGWKIFTKNFMAQSQHKCFGCNWSYGGNTCGLSFDKTTFFLRRYRFFFSLAFWWETTSSYRNLSYSILLSISLAKHQVR